MPYGFLLLASAVFSSPLSEGQEALADQVTEMCAVSSADSRLAGVEVIKKRAGDSFGSTGPMCAVYLKAWKAGYDFSYEQARSDHFTSYCKSMMIKIAENGTSFNLAEDLKTKFPDPFDRVAVTQVCSAYKSAFSDGVRYARDIIAK